MAIQIKLNIGKFQIAVSGKTEEEIFEQISFFSELPCECGLCKSKNVAPRHRRTKDYDFYEIVCTDCGATFACGQRKEGGLYPRGSNKKGHEGEWEPKYEAEDRDDDRGRGRDRDDDRRDSRRDDRRRDDPPPRRDDRRGKESNIDDDTIPF